jgi:N-acetylmuramoyl-L-alanine amidase
MVTETSTTAFATTTPSTVTTSSSTSTTVSTSTTAARKTTTTASRQATTSTAGRTSTSTAKATTSTTVRVARVLNGLSGAVIAIDPGHNGGNGSHPSEINRLVNAGGFTKACDTTGTSTNGGYAEAAYTFDVATRLAAVLRSAGATVVLTRQDNTSVGPCVDERAAIGNRADADAAISIHADGGPSGGRGFHVIEPALVKGYTEAIVAPSARLGAAVRASYATGTGMPPSTYAGKDGIAVRGDLGGLNLSTVPKVFIETGNMRNATDAALLTDAAFRQRAAEAIAAGLDAFLADR